MAVVVINYPARMLSLSGAALDHPEGIVHTVKEIIHIEDRPGWRKKTGPDSFYIRTGCGQYIDAAPEEAHHQKVRPCAQCAKRNKFAFEPVCHIRILPPVNMRPGKGGWSRFYWSRYYEFTPLDWDGAQGSLERTDPATPSA